MILKRQEYDMHNRIVTTWTPNVQRVTRYFDDDWQSDVLHVYFDKESAEPGVIVLDRNCGVYLTNDEGKTVEVIRRLQDPVRE